MDAIPISALQHALFCERQFALIHLEREWSENRQTAEGRVLHERAHEGPAESRGDIRTVRGISVASAVFGLTGQCDIVEFHRDGRVIPVEYKRGKPKSHRADEVQLCAQAVCLEEMLVLPQISTGYLFYGKPHRRTEVALDDGLRELTLGVAARAREILDSGITPSARYDKSKCAACSLIEICQPMCRKSAASWFAAQLAESHAPPISNLKSQIPTP
ncbi:MAG: CRISPR-associated protein Cas4 [Verrucomicrobiota bacterium]